jgi:Nucleosome binding factor SPN, SPT16 subunit
MSVLYHISPAIELLLPGIGVGSGGVFGVEEEDNCDEEDDGTDEGFELSDGTELDELRSDDTSDEVSEDAGQYVLLGGM